MPELAAKCLSSKPTLRAVLLHDTKLVQKSSKKIPKSTMFRLPTGTNGRFNSAFIVTPYPEQ